MGTPYAGGAQEREQREPRLASDTSYNAVAFICASMSEAQIIEDSLMESPLRLQARAQRTASGKCCVVYAGSA